MRVAKRLWYGAFINQRWTIGTAVGEVGSEAAWIDRGSLLKPLAGGDFLADPFVVPGTAGRVLLCEWMQARRGRGVIARVELDADNRIVDICKLIDWPPYHLSYPHVFLHEGILYCCVEACYSRSVRLFTLSGDARRVLSDQIILSDFAAVDPTIFEFQGQWWLLCTNASDNGSNSRLYAFSSDSPLGPWLPHASNPIVEDVSRARPAGRVFHFKGRMYRPVQDCSVRYGGGLRLFEIEALSQQEYRERECWSIYPPIGIHGQHGIHTVNSADGQIVFDAYTERFSLFAWLYRLRERIR